MNTFFYFFYERGLINNITNQDKVNEFFNNKKNAIYIGFDPTAKSLHLGNYVMITLLKRFKNNGFKTFAVLGGATGMIGDPSGKSLERNLLTENEIKNNIHFIELQLKKFSGAELFNNYEIYKNMNVLDYLRDIGKNINVNHVLERDIVKKRLETGISYTEFSYSIIQGFDFYYLYTNKNVFLQIGGSDQWSNITAGIDYIRKHITDNMACGLTINLLTKKDGTKFGKSEKGAIYLDENLTSPYNMYQFLLNQEDQDVDKLLNFLSFKTVDEIKQILLLHNKQPSKKIAQLSLAREIVSEIHGDQKLKQVEKISNLIFNNRYDELNQDDWLVLTNSVPTIYFEKNDNILSILALIDVIGSKTNARKLISQKAIKINNELVDSENYLISFLFFDKYAIVKKGKKDFFILKLKCI